MFNTKKVTLTQFTYFVPDWELCNCRVGTNPSKETCRFCVKTGKGCYTCALHNVPLCSEQGFMVHKTGACKKAMTGFHMNVVDNASGNTTSAQAPRKKTLFDYMMRAIKDYQRECNQEVQA